MSMASVERAPLDDTDYEPTDEDVRFYEEHGWFVTPPVLPDAVIDDALYGAERIYAGEEDTPLPLGGGYLDWRPEHGDTLRLNDYVSLRVEELGRLVRHPAIGRIAARLTGSPTIRLFHDQLVAKPPSDPATTTVVGWHTDKAYWTNATSEKLLTAWVPLVDMTEEMGPIMVVDGSHTWPVDGMRTFNEKSLDALERQWLDRHGPIERVPLVLKRGQVSFHHGRTIHGSPPNRSGTMRIALTVHLQDDGNRYQPSFKANGEPNLHINDLLVRSDDAGRPDYHDPEICPVLYPAPPADAPHGRR